MKTLVRLGLVALVLAGLVGGGALYKYFDLKGVGTRRAGDAAVKTRVVIDRGMGPRAISQRLAETGVIDDADAFYDYLRFVARKTADLRAGSYLLSPGMSADEIIEVLQTGKQEEQRFTVREGLRLTEIVDVIAASGISTREELLAAARDPKLVAAFGVPSRGAGGQKSVPGGIEGYLFPDTYQFPIGTPADKVLLRMRARLDEVLTDEVKARMKEVGFDLHKTLTLGAIVEKETGQPHERPHIASVFHNRLKQGMKLQTDPTVIYGIEGYDGNIRKKDLVTPHPYNTYVIPGLPPGPIASPGEAAIRAALWPDEEDDLYFVSKNDGTHIFCPTLECHNAAVQKWQVEFFRGKRRGG